MPAKGYLLGGQKSIYIRETCLTTVACSIHCIINKKKLKKGFAILGALNTISVVLLPSP